MLSELANRFPSSIRSPLAGIADRPWTHFVVAMGTQPMDAISQSGGLGSFDIRPRRLVEIGFAHNLRLQRTPEERQVQVCDFIAPLNAERFLSDPVLQYQVLAISTSEYFKNILDGAVEKPRDMSLAGALAVLHRGGRGALRAWPELFSNTRALYLAAHGAF